MSQHWTVWDFLIYLIGGFLLVVVVLVTLAAALRLTLFLVRVLRLWDVRL